MPKNKDNKTKNALVVMKIRFAVIRSVVSLTTILKNKSLKFNLFSRSLMNATRIDSITSKDARRQKIN